MFDFMRQVMAASSPESIPVPIPDKIAEFFVDQHEKVTAGATGDKEGEELPTTGRWFWRKLNQQKIARWLFQHRQSLWSTFYGSAQPGANS